MKQLEDGTWVDAETGEVIERTLKRLRAGAWVIPETCEIVSWPLPRRLQSAVDAALGACCALDTGLVVTVNRALRHRAERKLDDLRSEHDVLLARLEHGWGWLDRHPDGERFAEREGHVLAWLREYENVASVIRIVHGRLM